MPLQPSKYWHDILAPIVRGDHPPTIPQAVVLRENEVLLVQRDAPRLWELPGGSMLLGETPEQTVIREVREETGLDVVIAELLGLYERTGWRAHRSPVYVCHPTGDIHNTQDEDTITRRFFPLQALPQRMFPWYRPILQHDLSSPQPRPLQRTQHLGLWTLLQCTGLDLASRCSRGA
jgi:8-oxo-dGTP pyrophosphatase MutT (NUDIX family)